MSGLPDHGQGDILLADGARVFTCSKVLQDGARAAMLTVDHLFRIDVRSHDDSFDIQVRNLSTKPLDSTLRQHRSRLVQAFDGTTHKVTEFALSPQVDGIGTVAVTVTLPANQRAPEYRCTAMAVVNRA